MLKNLLFCLALILATSGTSHAATAIQLLQNGVNVLEDDDYESLAPGGVGLGDGDRFVEIGDVLFGVFELAAINGQVGTTNLTGLFAARVTDAVTFVQGAPAPIALRGSYGSFEFTGLTDAEWFTLFGITPSNTSGTTSVMVFENAEPFKTIDEATDLGSYGAMLAAATNGPAVFEFGFLAGTDVWSATTFVQGGTGNEAQDITNPRLVLSFDAALSVTWQAPSVSHIVFNLITSAQSGDGTPLPDAQVHLRGGDDGRVLGPDANNDGVRDPILKTDSNFYANLVVTPEPASMLVWAGIGLAGAVGGVIRRRRK